MRRSKREEERLEPGWLAEAGPARETRLRLFLLGILMALVAVGVGAVLLKLLFDTSLEQQQRRLADIAENTAALIGAIGRFDAVESADFPGGALAATLSQVRDALARMGGMGRSGEILVAREIAGDVEFLVRQRFGEPTHATEPGLAEPMRRALAGRSGTMTGRDYRGTEVIAGYSVVPDLGLGVVAKIDRDEVRRPFVAAALLAAALGIGMIAIGLAVFRSQTEPVIRYIEHNERRYRTLLQQVSDGVLLLSDRVEDANPAAARLLGRSPGELIGQPLEELCGAAAAHDMQSRVGAARHGPAQRFEWRCPRPDGGEIVAEVDMAAIDLGTEVPLVLATVHDITQRVQRERRLRETEERLTLALDSAQAGTWTWDIENDTVVWDDHLYRLFNIDEAIFGRTRQAFFALVYPPDRPHLENRLEMRLADGLPFEAEFRTGDGRRALATRGRVRYGDGKPVRMTGVCWDVTERHTAHEQLQLRTAALQAAANAVVITDAGGAIRWANPAFRELTGYEPAEVIGRNMRFLKSGHQPDSFYRQMWQSISAGEAWRGELLNRRKDGSLYTEEMTITPVKDDSGAITSFIAIKEDVTERRRVREALEASEQRFRALVERAPVGMLLLEADAGCVFANGAWCELCGQEGPPGHERSWIDAFHPEDQVRIEESWRDAHGAEYRLVRPDGSLRHIVLTTIALPDGRFLGTATDVSPQHDLQAKLLHSQKLDAIGRLAGGVAHDFNNQVFVIKGYSEMLLRALQDNPLRAHVEEIHSAAERGATLTRRLLAFSRKHAVEPRLVDPAQLLNGLDRVLGRLVGEDIRLRIRAEAGVGNVRIDPDQLEQVLFNLAVNARDAMPRGGELSIEATGVERPASTGDGDPPPGSYVRLRVSDTGVGMDEATRRRIFEPFFTTKGPEHGTGLGLSTVQEIVTQHGGFISVDSRPGEGTRFDIHLPRVEAPAEVSTEPRPRPATEGSSALDGATVLLVDGESSTRTMLREALLGEGAHVIEAADGGAALEQTKPGGEAVDAVVTQTTPPDMPGATLLQRIARERPDIRTLIVAGAKEENADAADLPPGSIRVPESATVVDLIVELESALASHRSEK